LSKSKMPPQQPDRLLDLFDEVLDFSAHCARPVPCSCPLATIACDAIARSDRATRISPSVVTGSPGQAGRSSEVGGAQNSFRSGM
jgi:hypothetical protein